MNNFTNAEAEIQITLSQVHKTFSEFQDHIF